VACPSSNVVKAKEAPIPRPGKATLAKRARERAKQAKQKEKEVRRAQRKEEKKTLPRPDARPDDGEDPDLAGMTPGPQAPLF
jgi:hypothetical protein